MNVVSLFSGVGGFELGFERAGYTTVFQCEIDKRCRSVLRRHFPTAQQWDDITTLTGDHIVQSLNTANRTPDVVIWGSPCQDLSVAGKRAGLDGKRSGLFYEGMRVINEIRKATNNEYPRVSIWENVYGALHSNRGADFGCIIDEMAEAGAVVVEWRVLDAQHFGVPQRRRRVFVVAIFDPATAVNCPDPLLPISEGVRWYPTASRTARQDSTGEATSSVSSKGHRMRAFGDYADDDTASAIKARDYKDATDLVVENPILIDRAAFNQGVNAHYDPIISDHPVTPSLVARGPHAVATHAVDEPLLIDGTRIDDVRIYDPPVQTLRVRMGTGGGNVPLIGFSHTQGFDAQPSEVAWPTLRKGGSGHAVVTHQEPTVFQPGTMIRLSGGVWDGVVPTLRAESKRGDNEPHISTEQPMAVRRLTPLECERLMGWCDDWTKYDDQGTEIVDGNRYKMCGNGVASPVAEWIAQQIKPLLQRDR